MNPPILKGRVDIANLQMWDREKTLSWVIPGILHKWNVHFSFIIIKDSTRLVSARWRWRSIERGRSFLSSLRLVTCCLAHSCRCKGLSGTLTNFQSFPAASRVRIAFCGLTINFYMIWFLRKLVALSKLNKLQKSDWKSSHFWLRYRS